MDKTIVERSSASQAFEWIVGLAAAAAFILITWFALDRRLDAAMVLWSSASIAVTAVGGALVYIVSAIAGATDSY